MTISAYAIPGIKECDRDIFSPQQKAEMIIDKVCKFYELNDLKLRSRSRERPISTARMFCIYFIRQKTVLTLKQTAAMFGGRDHTTAIHAIDFIKGQISAHGFSAVREDYEKLIQII